MSTPAKLITELSNLLGLDDLTIKEQIWPLLSSCTSPKEIDDYLQGLLGSGPAALSFISIYNTSRFPSKPLPPPVSSSFQSNSKPKFTSRNQQATSSTTSSSHYTTEIEQQRRAAIEREFEGSGGKVYLKNRGEDDYSYGSSSRNGSRNGSRGVSPIRSGNVTPTNIPVQSASRNNSSTLARSSTPSNVASSKGSSTASEVKKEVEGLVSLSMKGTMELLEIDRVLKTFEKGKGPVRECFCQARQHDLSLYTASCCPKCALVLCHLNLPISPCPSCSFSPLLSPLSILNFTTSLKDQRDLIIQRETLRIAKEKVQEEAEKAAIRFPTLADGRNGIGGGGGGSRAYSNMAGAGPDLNERIEMAYSEGLSLNGKPFGGKKVDISAGDGGGRVLKLDMKTKKVKIQTKVVRKILKEVKLKENNGVDEEEGGEDDEDGYGNGWIDEKDDGYSARSTSITTSTTTSIIDPSRPFINITLDENIRPIWEEEIIPEEEEEELNVNESRPTIKGIVPGAAIKSKGENGETKKKARSKVKKGTGVV